MVPHDRVRKRMSGFTRTGDVLTIPADQPIWFVSDLHLGDGTPSDVFFGKDRHLMALLAQVERENGVLVVNGDAMDFHQAWTFTRILRAHQELLSSMSRLARNGKLVYVIGNHDYDLNLYREILSFQVCEELRVGDRILVQHGYQYDPFIGKNLEGTHLVTKVHHLVERYLNTWIRIPLGEFYTVPNRLLFWLTHKVAVGLSAWGRVVERLGSPASAAAIRRQIDFWARSNMGDPMCIFLPVWQRLREDRWPFIVLGHSHLPGVVRQDGRAYANSGSWTFASSQYLHWDGEDIVCRDWITGREIGDDFYVPLLDGTVDEKDFFQWWRENYMGLLRFREGEERRGRLRGWESYIRDYQHFSQLRPYHPGPLPSPHAPALLEASDAESGTAASPSS